MNRLVVTADDFGLAPEVNAAVEQAHRSGILTAASLMVSGPAASGAVALARRMPGLRTGLHLVLVEGRPVLPPEEVASLVGPSGDLRGDMVRMAFELALRRRSRRELAAEIRAQFEAYRRSGLPLDHVNAHKHFLLHPTILSLILEIGCECGMRALRIPVEPLLGSDGLTIGRPFSHRAMRSWAWLLRARARARGLTVPDAVFGLAWTGAMGKSRILHLLGRLPRGLVEIYVHPATGTGFPGAAAGYDYPGELQALCDEDVLMAVADVDHERGGYADDAPHETLSEALRDEWGRRGSRQERSVPLQRNQAPDVRL